MKLKKGPKRVLIGLLIILVLAILAFLVYKTFFAKTEVKAAKVIHEIDNYGYKLKDNKSKAYNDLFYKLEKVLKDEPVDTEKYVEIISEMFIIDFYSLEEKTAKTDVGGTEFVYEPVLDDFLENAEDTFYKYVESNIYGQREQEGLPTVDKVTILDITQEEFAYGDKVDNEAYKVQASWTYTEDCDYQNEATMIFIHDGIKLSLVESKNETNG